MKKDYRKAGGIKTLAEMIDEEYKARPLYDVQFSIKPEAYQCSLGDRITFGDSHVYNNNGVTNIQDVILDGNVIGWIEEKQSPKLLHPMTVSFNVWLADYTEEETITDEARNNQHFHDAGDYFCLRFATLQQMLEHLGVGEN